MLVNLYGPNENSDLESFHVIPALLRKCVEVKNIGRHEVVRWADASIGSGEEVRA